MIKKFLIIIFLIFNLPSLSIADDIQDFEIEEMSIGDSALDFFNKDELNKLKEYYSSSDSKTFFLTNVYSSNFEIYDNIMFHFKDNDTKYIIHSISAAIFFSDAGIKNKDECIIKRNEIDVELKQIFKNLDRSVRENHKHEGDKTGKSFTHTIFYWFEGGGNAAVSCSIYSKEFGGTSHLKVMVNSKDLEFWVNNVVYE